LTPRIRLYPVCWLFATILVAFWALVGHGAPGATAAESEFVGVLALAIETDVAESIGLTEQQEQKLLEIIDARENEALEMAIRLKDLPVAERTAKLVPFRRESESQGLALLSKQQRARLQQIQVARWGMASLVSGEMGGQLKLTPQQQTQLTELLRERSERLIGADEKAAEAVRAEIDGKLGSMLDAEHKAAPRVLPRRRRRRRRSLRPSW